MKQALVTALVFAGGCGTTPCLAPDAAAGTTTTWHEYGACFRVVNCCANDGCASGLVCNNFGHCVPPSPRMCGCASDTDCAEPGRTHCVANDAVCGACVVAGELCDATTPCAVGQTCIGGYCAEDDAICIEPSSR